jgi:hypothetical protein
MVVKVRFPGEEEAWESAGLWLRSCAESQFTHTPKAQTEKAIAVILRRRIDTGPIVVCRLT